MLRTVRIGILLATVGSLAIGLTGCPLFLIGGGVLGGLAISEDTVRSDLDKPFNQIWDIAHQELKAMGAITLQDREHGRLEANVESGHVWITLDQLTPKTVRLEIKARKNMLPKIKLAQKVSTRILKRL